MEKGITSISCYLETAKETNQQHMNREALCDLMLEEKGLEFQTSLKVLCR